MGFDDFFEDKRKHHGNYRERGYHGEHDDHEDNRYSYEQHYPAHRNEGHLQLFAILNKIRNNRKLKIIVIMAVIVLLIIAVALITALLPLIIKLFNYISQNGIQSIFDSITGFLDKLWKGSGK
jgi:uncharacterized membrane protein